MSLPHPAHLLALAFPSHSALASAQENIGPLLVHEYVDGSEGRSTGVQFPMCHPASCAAPWKTVRSDI